MNDIYKEWFLNSDFKMYCISGSYAVISQPPPPPPVVSDGFKEFFEKLGYTVTGDRAKTDFWYDVRDGNTVVFQCDQGISLDIVIDDLCHMHLGTLENTPVHNYKVWYDNEDETDIKLLAKRVYDYKMLNTLPSGQQEFKL